MGSDDIRRYSCDSDWVPDGEDDAKLKSIDYNGCILLDHHASNYTLPLNDRLYWSCVDCGRRRLDRSSGLFDKLANC